MSKIRILKEIENSAMEWVRDTGIIVEFDTAGEALRWLKKQTISSESVYHMIRIVKTLTAEKKVVETVELAEK